MQLRDISDSMLSLKALKNEGRALTEDEVNRLLDHIVELFSLRKEVAVRNFHFEKAGAEV